MRTLTILLAAALIWACGSEESEHGGQEKGHWKTRTVGSVFQVSLPDGWKATQQKRSGKLLLSGRGGVRIVIWPLYIPGAMRFNSALAVCDQLSRQESARAQWQPPQPVGQNLVAMQGEDGGESMRAQLVWFSGGRGTLGFYSFLQGPEEELERQRPVIARILNSVRMKPPAKKQARRRRAYRWVRWQEPSENAFAFQIPASWRIGGGMIRYSPIDVRTDVRLASPDGAIEIFIGDQNLPYFALPNWTLQMGGLTEGNWYNLYGNRLLIQRYTPAHLFLQQYLPQRFGRELARFHLVRAVDRRDLAARIQQIHQQMNMMGMYQRQDYGEALFGGNRGGAPWRGYCLAATLLTSMNSYGGSMGIWQVTSLYGFLAREDHTEEASQVLSHMIRTLEVNPQWYQMQHKVTGNVSQVVSATQRAISDMITQTYNSVQHSQDESMRKFSNYLRGVVDVRDPQSQTSYKVQSGSNYYWIDAMQNIVGTNLYENPDVLRFRQMVEY